MAEVRKEHSSFSRIWKIWKDKDISFKSSSIGWHGTGGWEKISWTKQMTREFEAWVARRAEPRVGRRTKNIENSWNSLAIRKATIKVFLNFLEEFYRNQIKFPKQICIKYLINCWPKRYKNDQKLNFLSILLPPLPDAREFHIFTYLFLFPFRSGGKFSSWGRTQEAWGSAPLHRVTVFPHPREIRPCTFYKGIIFEIIKKFWFMNVFSLGKTGWLNTFFPCHKHVCLDSRELAFNFSSSI